MRNSLSDRASSKILKFIAFFVILIAVYFIQGRWILPRFFTMPHAVLFAAVLAYLLISLSGLIMRASHKAAAAVLVFIALYALVIYFFDDFQAYVPFLTGTNIVRIVCAAAFALMVWDIYTVAREFIKPREHMKPRDRAPRERRMRRPDGHIREKEILTEDYTENEEEILRYALSLLLESRWGRTPTENEVTEYARNVYANRQ